MADTVATLQLLRPPRSTGDRERDGRALQQWLADFYRIAITENGLASTTDTAAEIEAAVDAAFAELQANIDAVLPTPYTLGALLYATSTTELTNLSPALVGNALISQGVGLGPAYGKIGLTTHVSGTLAVGNGGTGLTAGTSGGVLGYTATGTLASSALLTANALMVGGGAGALPSTPLGLGTTGQVLRASSASSPTWSAATYPSTVNANEIMYATGSNAFGSGSALTFDGTSLTLGATSSRLIADCSNATIANRFAIQTSAANSTTTLTVIPSGTGTTSQIALEGSSAATNSSVGQLICIDATEVRLASSIRGGGTYVPITMYTSGVKAVEIDTSQNVSFSAGVKFGTYTAGVVVQAGYIDITDSGGTARRLLVG